MHNADAPRPGSLCCSGYQLCATPEAIGVARLLALPSRSNDQHDDRATAVPQSKTQPPWKHFAGSKPSPHNAEEAPPAPPPRCVADERDGSSAMPARRPTPELRYGHHPVGPDSPVRACALLCDRRPCEEQPCARVAGGIKPPHHPVQRRMHRRESSAPVALVAASDVVRVAAWRQRPGDGARKQRRASAAIE